MRLLDLFCGAGGAAMGYHQAGFTEIVGIDIVPQPDYPFTFIQGDALRPPVELDRFDLIHASPPCQRFSSATVTWWVHPDLIVPTRQLLDDRPYVIENVARAGLRGELMLCGSGFGLQVQRHRYFELQRFSLVMAPACNHKSWADGRPWTVTGDPSGFNQGIRGGRNRHKYQDDDHARELMDVPWITDRRGVVEAIPPAYTKFIGEHFFMQMVNV